MLHKGLHSAKSNILHGFNSAKCKTSLKLALARIKLLKNKKQQVLIHLRKEVAQLLQSGQDQTARIRVEHVIREEKTIAAFEFLEVFCEVIVVRLPIIESQKSCPLDLKEAIASVIFASQRCPDIVELADVRKRLAAKYGKEFAAAALELRPNSGVSSMMVEKLAIKTPDIQTKLRVLASIATEHGIDWEPTSFEEQVKPSQDERLVGPSSFDAAKTGGSESTPSKFSVKTSLNNEPATKPPEQSSHLDEAAMKPPEQSSRYNEPARKPSEKEVQSPERYSASSLTSNSVSAAYQSESRPTEFMHQSTQSENSHSRGTDDSLEFKNASSAARAAAESAERAKIAARAAAEFALQESGPRQFETRYNEASQRTLNTASMTKGENIQADFKNPEYGSNKRKETSESKFREHQSSEITREGSTGKSKEKEETFETLKSSSNRTESFRTDKPDPNFYAAGRSSQRMSSEQNATESFRTDKPDPNFFAAGRSSQRISSEQNAKHGQRSRQTMQDEVVLKRSAVTVDDEEEEMKEELSLRSNSSHYHTAEDQHVRSSSSHYHRSPNDSDSLLSDDELTFFRDRIGKNIDAERIRAEKNHAQSGYEKTESSSFKSSRDSFDGNMHSATQNRRESLEIDDETGDHGDNQHGSSCSAVAFDEYGSDDNDYINVFNTSNDNAFESDLLRSNSSYSSLHQGPGLYEDNKREPPIEGYMNSHIFSTKAGHTENAEESPTKSDELSSEVDEVLPPKFDEIDECYDSDSEHDVDILSHHEDGKSSSTMGVSEPGRGGSLNIHNGQEDQIGQELKLDIFSSGFGKKRLVRPPYIRTLPESQLSSKEMADDLSNGTGHGSNSISEKFMDEKALIAENTSPLMDFDHFSNDKLPRRNIYDKESYNDDDGEQGFNRSKWYSEFDGSKENSQSHSHVAQSSSERLSRRDMYHKQSHDDDADQSIKSFRQYSDSGSPKQGLQSHSHYEHSSSTRLSGRDIYGRKSYKDDAKQGLESSKQYSDSGGSEQDPQAHSRFTHSSINRLSGTDVYGKKSYDDDDVEQSFKGSRQYSAVGSSRKDPEPHTHFEQSSSDRFSGRDIYGKISYDNDDAEERIKSSRQRSGFGSSKEDPQPQSPVSSRRTRNIPLSRRTKGVSILSDSEPLSTSHQLDGELLSMSSQPDTETGIKHSQSKSDDMRSRWNEKFNSPKSLKSENANSSWKIDELSMESSDISLHDVTCTEELKKEVKITSGSDRYNRSYKKTEAEISSPSASRHSVLADTQTPSKSDMKNRWNSKFSQSSEKHLVPPVQADVSSRYERRASPSTIQPITKGMPESLDGSPSKSDTRNRRSQNYSPLSSEEQLAAPVQRKEPLRKESLAPPSVVQHTTKGMPESLDGSPSKSDTRNRWSKKFSPSLSSEEQLAPPVQRKEPLRRESLARPSVVQPTNKAPLESLDVSSSKSDVGKRWNKKHSPQPSDANTRCPVRSNQVSESESQISPPPVQPTSKGAPASSDGALKKEKHESHSSRQPPSVQSEDTLRSTPGPAAASMQNVRSDLASTTSDVKESPRFRESVDSPRQKSKPPPDYDSFAAHFRALRGNVRKK